MGKLHIKRIAAPRSWPINRKSTKWIYRPRAGTHKLENALPLGTILKEILNLVKTTKEVKYILTSGEIKVNGKVRKDQKFPVGLMDVLSYKSNNYRILFDDKGYLTLVSIKEAESKLFPKKITGKKSLKGKKTQINLFDGTNLISDDKNIKSSDTIILENGKIKDYLKLEKGSIIYITHGKQVGKIGIVKEIKQEKSLNPAKIIFTQNKDQFETIKDYAFVIGKTKPMITLPNE